VSQHQSRVSPLSPAILPPELQVKSITLNYPEFCLLIGLVAAQANSDQDSTGEWRRLYVRLGGAA
jgi:hypothetical protein